MKNCSDASVFEWNLNCGILVFEGPRLYESFDHTSNSNFASLDGENVVAN